MTDREWQSFSNWCPGDVIDNRIISLGAYEAGNHEVMITVPDAKFVGKQGDIPVSLYFHGLKDGKFESGIKDVTINAAPVSIDKNGVYLMIGSEKDVVSVEVYTIDADMVHRQWNRNPIDVSSLTGVHVVCVEFADGSMVGKKIML